MNITKKSINEWLERRDVLRRRYILHGETGCVGPGVRTFASAWVLIRNGECVGIYDYGVGDAIDSRVICPDNGTRSYDISDIVTDWLRYAEAIGRMDVINRIYDTVNADAD